MSCAGRSKHARTRPETAAHRLRGLRTTHDHRRGTHRRCRWPLLGVPCPRARTCSLSLASGAEIPRACSLSVDLNGASRIARVFHHVFARLHGISRRTAPKIKVASIPVLKEYSRKFFVREKASRDRSNIGLSPRAWRISRGEITPRQGGPGAAKAGRGGN